MSRFNFTGLYAIIKALYSTTSKDDTKAVIVSDKVKNDTTIEFKNGSYIKVLTLEEGCVRGNRSKIIYPSYNHEGTVDYYINKEMLDEVLAPFCKYRENNDIDGQILYVSSKGELMNNLEKEKIQFPFQYIEQYFLGKMSLEAACDNTVEECYRLIEEYIANNSKSGEEVSR